MTNIDLSILYDYRTRIPRVSCKELSNIKSSEDLKSHKHLCFRFIFHPKINVWSSPLPLQSSKHVAASGPHKMEAGRESSPVDLRWVLAGSFSYIWEMPKPPWKDATFIWLRHSKATRCETCKHFTWLAPLTVSFAWISRCIRTTENIVSLNYTRKTQKA